MNVYIIKIIEKIKQFCTGYLELRLDLPSLQRTLSAFCSNFDNGIPQEFQQKVNNFVEDLEYIRFMYNQNEQFEMVAKKILELNLFMEKLTKSV
jgi:hypothetical protein